MLIGSIVPRPIALVTTLSNSGTLNAAPFSYFNIVADNPPMVSISVQRRSGKQKDTARNAAARGEFVIHIADASYVEQLNRTAASLSPEESEVEWAGLTPASSERVVVPGLAEAKIRMECKLVRSIPLGGTEEEPACDLLIGEIVLYHIDETLYDEQGHIDPVALNPVGRMTGNDYVKLGERFTLQRPE
ncbi:flavin reductase family protein [Paenibacillus sp. NPDC058071]|uniref:flavin reductase family protein n=1 Tax=Paenibacillus sp. NPDC058071 TaxID=3346326 RepID=UPI0036DD9FDA